MRTYTDVSLVIVFFWQCYVKNDTGCTDHMSLVTRTTASKH